MDENRLMNPADIWFDPRPAFRSARNALLDHPESVAEFGLSVAPGSGEAMSLRDAWNASGRAGEALTAGNYGQAASEYGNLATGVLGAIPGVGVIARGTRRGADWMNRNLPGGVNRMLDGMMPANPQSTTFSTPTPWVGSRHVDRYADELHGQTPQMELSPYWQEMQGAEAAARADPAAIAEETARRQKHRDATRRYLDMFDPNAQQTTSYGWRRFETEE